MIVGVEGPVLAGKSTLVDLLVQGLSTEGVDCVACPCYVEVAKRLGCPIPAGLSRSVAEQLAALRFFVEIDRLRRPLRVADLLLLDRTTWTLLAHSHALVAVGAIPDEPVRDDDATRRALQAGKPEVLVYLDVPWEVQLARSAHRPGLQPLFLDRAFNAAFRSYFVQTAEQHRALWLDATQPPQATAAAVVDYLRSIRPKTRAETADAWDDSGHGTGCCRFSRR